MSIKYALIQNIVGLTCLLCHLLHSRRFSGHFIEPGLYCISDLEIVVDPGNDVPRKFSYDC